ncbi:MAG: hypothetical protein JO306_12105, partial [Gemmatimonadetes bacterium]|nr:hypothetical protein [Gemmatimonadota bacterium]
MTTTRVHPDANAAAAEAFLADGSLAVAVDPRLRDLVEPWMPRLERPRMAASSAAALLRVEAGAPHVPAPGGEPEMELVGIGGWLQGDEVLIADPKGR